MAEICRQRVHDVMVTVRFASSAVILSALCAAVSLVPATAGAQGLFDFLFGGFRQLAPRQESYPAAPAPGIGRIAPAPLGQESVTEGGGSTGHGVAFCVRLCDGQHFPVEQIINGTPEETCRAICPYSKPRSSSAAKSAAPSPKTASVTVRSTPRSCTASNWSPIAPATAETHSD